MKYQPKHYTVKEIMLARGFTYAHPQRGWIRNQETNTRLHALIQDGIIDIHLDEPHPDKPNQHKSRKFSKSVVKEIEAIKKYDSWFSIIYRWIRTIV